MIHEEICTYEVCKLAKEKGFNEECREFYCYDKSQKRITRISCNRHMTSFDYCSDSMLEDYYPPHEYCYIAVPTQSLLQRWLREEKGIDIAVVPLYNGGYSYIIYNIHCRDNRVVKTNAGYSTYELALEDALDYSLKNLV